MGVLNIEASHLGCRFDLIVDLQEVFSNNVSIDKVLVLWMLNKLTSSHRVTDRLFQVFVLTCCLMQRYE